MTKASAIMVCPVVPLRQLPPQELDVIRRFLFQHMRGMDARHEKRWRRLWRRIWDAAPGEGFQLYPVIDRKLSFHRRWMAIERRIFDNQEAFAPRHIDRFRDWLKTGAAWGRYELVNGRMRFVPGSLKYDECSDDEMREFAEAAEAFLRTPRAARKLWPHLKLAQRAEMVETLLANPEGDHQ